MSNHHHRRGHTITTKWVGPWLRSTRKYTKKTIQQVASFLGSPTATIKARERGGSFPVDILPMVLAAYGLSFQSFSAEVTRIYCRRCNRHGVKA